MSVIKLLNASLMDRLRLEASASPRLRTNFNLHSSPGDGVQRFINTMQPGTYIRPHRHDDPAKWELVLVLSGRLAMLLLQVDGTVTERIELDAAGPQRGIELPARTWHTSAVLAPDTVLLEVKPGPYDAPTDKTFAPWAPAEGDPGSTAFELRLRCAQPGNRLAD